MRDGTKDGGRVSRVEHADRVSCVNGRKSIKKRSIKARLKLRHDRAYRPSRSRTDAATFLRMRAGRSIFFVALPLPPTDDTT